MLLKFPVISAVLGLLGMLPLCAAGPEITETPIFTNGADGYPVYRIPAIIRANDGTLLAFCEGRAGSSDGGNIDLVLKRSSDNGLTWGPLILVHDEGGSAAITIGNPAPVVDRSTGHIHLLFCRENDTVFHTVSTDNGLTWSARNEITSSVKQAGWGWYATGPVHGIQLEHGAQAGRLVIPANHRIGAAGSDSGAFGAQILYSDDHGATWHMDAVFEAANGAAPNETTLMELNTPGTSSTSTQKSFSSSDVPKTISPSGTPTVTSTLDVTGVAGTVEDVNVTLDITHTYASDLTLTLIHPDGTRIELSSRNGGSGDNYNNTTFNQTAGSSIIAGTAPFTGSFIPEGDLNNLNGKPSNGQWKLEVADAFNLDGGALNSWSVSLKATAPVTTGSHLYINSRDYGSDAGNRSEAYSGDGGASYSVPYNGNSHFVTPVCQGSLLDYSSTNEGDSNNRVLFSSPNGSSRANGSLWISADETATWSQPKSIRPGGFAYSDMVRTSDDHLGVMFETNTTANGQAAISFIRANEAWLDAPPPPAEDPGAAFWNFEETAPGGNASLAADAILDGHPAAHDLHLTAESAFPVAAGPASFGGGRALSLANNGGLQISDADTTNRFDFGSNDSFTLEIVCRMPAGSTQTAGLIAKDLGATSPSWWLRVEGGKARFLISDNATERFFSSAASINDGQWHHIAAVRDATDPAAKKLRLYIDGQLSGTLDDTTTDSLANSQALRIGRFNASGRDFTGDIDSARITPAALAPEDFINSTTQFDADGDKIPDDFERAETGSLAPFGDGDSDGDGTVDLLEFAIGGDPAISDRVTQNVTVGTDFIEVHTRQRELPAWLDLRLLSSGDLLGWSDSNSTVTLSAPDDGIFSRVDRLDFPLGVPDRLFLRYQLVDLP